MGYGRLSQARLELLSLLGAHRKSPEPGLV
jgi:hypothetical protein